MHGPVLLCTYAAELSGSILQNHGVSFKLYADDTQIYMTLDNIDHTKTTLSKIMEDVRRWMYTKHVKINEEFN